MRKHLYQIDFLSGMPPPKFVDVISPQKNVTCLRLRDGSIKKQTNLIHYDSANLKEHGNHYLVDGFNGAYRSCSMDSR